MITLWQKIEPDPVAMRSGYSTLYHKTIPVIGIPAVDVWYEFESFTLFTKERSGVYIDVAEGTVNVQLKTLHIDPSEQKLSLVHAVHNGNDAPWWSENGEIDVLLAQAGFKVYVP